MADTEFVAYEEMTARILSEWTTLGEFMDAIGDYLTTKKARAEAESRVRVTEGMAKTYNSQEWAAAVPHERAALDVATKAHTEALFKAVETWKCLTASEPTP